MNHLQSMTGIPVDQVLFYLFFYLQASFVLGTMEDLRIQTWSLKIPAPRKPNSFLMKFGEGQVDMSSEGMFIT